MANITKINLKGIEYNLTDTEAQNLIAQLRESTYNKTEVDTLVGAIDDKIDAIDMASYAKTADVDAQLATKADKEDTYTKEEVNTLGNQLKAIAEARLPIDSFNTWSETVATKQDLADAVAGVDVTEQLKEYAKKSDIPAPYDDTAISGRVATLEAIDHSQYLTEHQDISGKVDKVSGKGLSTNDYTAADKAKVDATPTFWVGTQAEYDAIAVKDNKTFYYITEE